MDHVCLCARSIPCILPIPPLWVGSALAWRPATGALRYVSPKIGLCAACVLTALGCTSRVQAAAPEGHSTVTGAMLVRKPDSAQSGPVRKILQTSPGSCNRDACNAIIDVWTENVWHYNSTDFHQCAGCPNVAFPARLVSVSTRRPPINGSGYCDAGSCSAIIDNWIANVWYYESTSFTECANCPYLEFPDRLNVSSSCPIYSFKSSTILLAANTNWCLQASSGGSPAIRLVDNCKEDDLPAQLFSLLPNGRLQHEQSQLYLMATSNGTVQLGDLESANAVGNSSLWCMHDLGLIRLRNKPELCLAGTNTSLSIEAMDSSRDSQIWKLVDQTLSESYCIFLEGVVQD